MNNNFSVYRHIAPNGKMYVGVTSREPDLRWGLNGSGYKKQSLFYNAIKKYGWDNFQHEILLTNLTETQASLAEQLFIYYWDLTNRDKGYNLMTGGITGAKHTQSTKDKISKGNKGKVRSLEYKQHLSEMRQGVKHHNYGKHLSEETKQKISKANKGKECKIKRFGKNAPMYGKHHSEKTKQLYSQQRKGKNNSFYGKHHTEESKQKMRDNLPKRAVAQIDIQTNEIINTFISQKEAERQTGIYHSNIAKCCKGKSHHAGGYKWRYIDRP